MAGARQVARGDYITLAACIGVAFLAMLGALAQTALPPVLSEITRHFAAEPNAGALVRFMLSGMTFATIFGSLFGGFLGEKLGQRVLLFWALGLFALFGSLGGFIDNIHAIVASRLALGVIVALTGVVATAVITTRIAPDSRNRWMGYNATVGTFGGVAVLMLAGWLGSIDWRTVFYLHLIALPVLAYLWFTLPPPERPIAVAAERQDVPQLAFPWRFSVFAHVSGILILSPMIFLPFHFAALGHGEPSDLAIILATLSLAAGISAFTYGRVRARLSTLMVFYLGFGAQALGLAMLILSGQYALILTGMALIGIGSGQLSPNLFATIAAAAPPELRARMLGITRAFFYAGPLVAQLLFEPLIPGFGVIAPIWGLCAVALVGMAVAKIVSPAFLTMPD